MIDWNQPDPAAVLRPWLRIDPLTIFQAVMLTFGRDPSHECTGKPKGYVPMSLAMKQAIQRGELPALRTINTDEGEPYSLDVEDMTHVRQADVRNWLEKIGQGDAFGFYPVSTDGLIKAENF